MAPVGSETRTTRGTGPPSGALHGDIAIVGMACLYPQAPSHAALWENVVAGVDAITEMPPERIPPAFYDPHSGGNDRTYCRRGGFLGDAVPFDPLPFGIMPVVVECGDPEQLLALKVAHEALRDAGYDPERANGERIEVIIGRGNYANRALSTAQHHVSIVNNVVEVLKAFRPEISAAELARLREELLAGLPRFGAENAASLVPNFTTGRIANRFDFMGTNFTVDAACASSLVALELAVRDLLSGKCDAALIGGAFILSDLTHIAVLTQIQALSRRSEIRPFDRAADGTLPGEGVGILVLKRLEDAQRDGSRIYAVVKGVGTSSDGRALGLLAPRVEGEELALRRAYEMAGIDPATVGLIEAHGTGTPAGDAAEIEALARVFGRQEPDAAPRCALGTIKSMIGHPLPAAGAAGLIKAALALHHKILPPTLHCEQPNPKLEETPFYVNTTARPWIHGGRGHPRRAGVSAFGFGGVNAHVILEEYPEEAEDERPGLLTHWPTELCILEAPDRAGLLQRLRDLSGALVDPAPDLELKDLAFTLNSALEGQRERLAFVVESIQDLRGKIERAGARLADADCRQIKDLRGIYYFAEPLARSGKLALLFPGEGAQYVGMLADLCHHFPVVRRTFDRAAGIGTMEHVFPPPWPKERERAEARLWTSVSGAVEAVLAADTALLALFQKLRLRPDAILGHSSGEFVACLAAGIVSEDVAMSERLSRLWHAFDAPLEDGEEAGLLAVGAPVAVIMSRLGELAGRLTPAMENCPHQVVLAGPADALDPARERLLAANIICERLPFHRPYHTAAFSAYLGPVEEALRDTPLNPPSLPIYSCTTAGLYPAAVPEIRRLMVDQWRRPVRFEETIRALYADGVRLFLELGPRGNLTAFVEDILRGETHLAICADSPRRHGLTQLNHVLALLSAHAVPLRLDELFLRRSPQRADLGRRPVEAARRAAETRLALAPIRLRLGDRAGDPAERHPAPSTQRPAGSREPGAGSHPATADRSAPIAAPEPRRAGSAVASALLAVPPARQALSAAHETQIVAVDAVGAASAPADEPMLAYFRMMEQFLAVQEEVMQEALLPAPFSPDLLSREGGSGEGVAISLVSYPLLGTVTSYHPGEALEAERILSLDADPFLLDHTFGHKISVDSQLRAIATVPATVSMEIMAEAASALLPGWQVIGVRSFQSLQWMNVTERPARLRIRARHAGEGAGGPEVQVSIWSGEAGAEVAADNASPAAEGRVLLASGYPPAPPATPFPLRDARPYRARIEELYEWLFHGPQFQAIRRLHQFGDDGLLADLTTRSLDGFRGSLPGETTILDPVVLDGAGQLSAAWVYEQFADPGMLFPVQIDEVTFYGPRVCGPAVLPCRLRVHTCGARRIRADMEILEPDGRVHTRITGWHHHRIHCPAHRIRASRDSRKELSGELWELPAAPLPSHGQYVACQVDGIGEKGSATMEEASAHIVLSRREREEWRAYRGPKNRRAQWLLGRTAAKDAARVYLLRRYGIELYPADVEVIVDARGRPQVTGTWAKEVSTLPALSIAHTGVIGVALAGGAGPDDTLGIDVERIRSRDAGFLDVAFSPAERARIEALDAASQAEWATRFWCAREAVAKAVGYGLVDGPAGLTIERVDRLTGRIEVALAGALARLVPHLSSVPVIVYTARSGDLVVASTACEKAEEGS